eukprot:1945318-Pyramimonas_sp.AAC.1
MGHSAVRSTSGNSSGNSKAHTSSAPSSAHNGSAPALRRGEPSRLHAHQAVTAGATHQVNILTMDQSDAGSAGIFARWTNQTQEAR